jgi:uncharacterized BrkB/YihY/UPF0761 family membrane protein
LTVKLITGVVDTIDRWQQRNPVAAPTYGVVKKFGDDQANLLVVALGWYGFVSIYPLLLLVITIFGYIGAASLGHGIVSTLHQFPVVGDEFNPANGSSELHGNSVALIVALFSLIYGAQGVTQTAQQAMARVWNIPQYDRPAFLPRLARSLIALVVIGGTFLFNAAAATFATAAGTATGITVLVIIGMLLVNCALQTLAFFVLTPKGVTIRQLVPGAALAAFGFTLLITVGSGLIQHQIRHSSSTYGQFGVIIGLVGFLFLVAKINLYGAELNPVLARRLWPRSIAPDNATPADEQVLRALAHEERRRDDERIGVGFGDDAVEAAAADARHKPRK